jgi:hypothetical protein
MSERQGDLKKLMKNHKKELSRINKKAGHRFSWRLFWENFILKEGDTYYKMPSLVWKHLFYKNIDSYEKAKENLEIIEKYFWKVLKIADTEIIQNTDGHYIIKQKEVWGKKVTKEMLEQDPILYSKFKKLILINEIMWEKEHFFLDILGTDFAVDPFSIHNIIADGSDIYLFDFWLLEKTSKSYIFNTVSKLSRWFQLKVVKYFF